MKKRVIATILAGAAMLGIVACATLNKQDEKQEVKQENVDMKNPITKCNSLEELNEKMAIKLCAPGVMGVNDIAYQIIDNGDYQIGEYIFEVAGKEYDFRNASTREDISGIYINGENAFNKEFENGEEIQYASSEEVKAARWFTLDGQYCLSVKDDNKMSMDDFKSTVNELYGNTSTRFKEMDYTQLDGNYQDSTSQRAKATVKSTETGANIVIEWANDANSLTTWTMDVKQSEDGLLSFKNCTKTVDGKVEYTDKDGFFNYVDGKLIWNGAVDTECQECIFIKI